MQPESSRTGTTATTISRFASPDGHLKESFRERSRAEREEMKPFDQTPGAGSVADAILLESREF